MFESETIGQLYGDKQYLAHNLKGQTTADDRALFGMRVPSYGIFNFGAMTGAQVKRIVLAAEGIVSPIELRSIYAFNATASSDEIKYRLYAGSTEILEYRLNSAVVPYEFPPGAIIDPSLSIEVEPRYDVSQLLIYWQPVHVLSYIEVS